MSNQAAPSGIRYEYVLENGEVSALWGAVAWREGALPRAPRAVP